MSTTPASPGLKQVDDPAHLVVTGAVDKVSDRPDLSVTPDLSVERLLWVGLVHRAPDPLDLRPTVDPRQRDGATLETELRQLLGRLPLAARLLDGVLGLVGLIGLGAGFIFGHLARDPHFDMSRNVTDIHGELADFASAAKS